MTLIRRSLAFALVAALAACGTTAASSATTDATAGDDTAADVAGTDAAADVAPLDSTGSDAAGTDAAADVAGAGTTLTGTLGDLGAIKPTVSSLMIANSGETLIYMSSEPITCDMLTVSHWLKSVKAGAQVVEIVIKGDPKVTTIQVPPGEVNYAAGGKSSSYEVNADSGSITFTKAEAKNVVDGTLSATYGNNSISGTFHATFCTGGQGY